MDEFELLDPQPTPQRTGRRLLRCCGLLVALSLACLLSSVAIIFVGGDSPFDLQSIPTPAFPDETQPVYQDGVWVSEVVIDSGDHPGGSMALRIYRPPGVHAPGSLSCVVIAGAGANRFSGMQLGDGDVPEHLPYAQAGLVVVAYDVDGHTDSDDLSEIFDALSAFKASAAGLVNARNAVTYAATRIPEVDPKRIFSAGHSSAGTLSLLVASHERRLAGCIAYAPATQHSDPDDSVFIPIATLLSRERVGPFLKQSSPLTHVERHRCPTFLFHSVEDGVTPYADTRHYADRLEDQGVEVTFVKAKGDHYQPMIDEGIPAAIRWLKAAPGATPAPARDEPTSWSSRPPDTWPQLVLTNDATFKDNQRLRGASAFLLQGEDAVYAATAAHLLGPNGGLDPEVPFGELDARFATWKLHPRTRPQEVVNAEGMAFAELESDELDWLVLTLEPGQDLPASLQLSSSPARVGDPVWVIGVPYSDRESPQNVYRGEVTERDGGWFRYRLETPVNLRGFSGAPIVNASGRLVGVMTIWFDPPKSGLKHLEGGGLDAEPLRPFLEKR